MTEPTRNSLEDRRCEAVRLLDAASAMPPADLKAEVDSAEQVIVALRDLLIDRLRSTPSPAVRDALDRVNAAASLVVGLEYPMGGLQRTMLEDARTVLLTPLDHEG
ncbi:MAG: hypothetical protein M3069_09000 [Chloroflexota bacterium]|nr:hypothetical protein [Chloroflexota bacterium]